MVYHRELNLFIQRQMNIGQAWLSRQMKISLIGDYTIIKQLICAITYFVAASSDAFSHSSYSLYNRHKLYQQGIDKFTQETDIVYYAKSLRMLKTLLSSLMDDSERYLSVFQHQNCLRLVDSYSNEDDAPDEIRIPKLFSDSSKIVPHNANINEFFENYLKEKFTAKDYRLLKGVFCNEELKNDELELFNPDKEVTEENFNPGNENLSNDDYSIQNKPIYYSQDPKSLYH